MAFRHLETTKNNEGNLVAWFKCDYCDDEFYRFVPYKSVKCDSCGQGYRNPRWYQPASESVNQSMIIVD